MKVVDRAYLSIGITEQQLNGGEEWVKTHRGTSIVETPLWVFISLGVQAIQKESEDKV